MIVLFLISISVIVAGIIMLTSIPNNSKCTGNCNQGRTCDCGEK